MDRFLATCFETKQISQTNEEGGICFTFPRSAFLGGGFLLPDAFLEFSVFLALQFMFLEDLGNGQQLVTL
jgi:hypothetical protein